MTVIPKTPPYPYQADELKENGARDAWGVFWEPGLGKSKVLIDTAAELEDAGEIGGMIVLAPNGVHYNWVRKELPAHLPDELADRTEVMYWNGKKARQVGHKARAAEVMSHEGFRVLCMSYDSVMTDPGQKYLRKFLDERDCIYGLDESHRIKTPGAKRTIRVLASAKYAPWRRLLTGTLVADSPFDVYTQLKFLNPEVWHEVGCKRFEAFKSTFGIWETMRAGDREFPHLVDYRNLETLTRIVDENGSRLLAEDVLDLPPKNYEKRYFDLTPEQLRAYEDLRKEFSTFLAGGYIDAPLAITRLLRLQQVTSGFLPTENPEDEGRIPLVMTPIGGYNPRIDAMLDVVTRERPNEQGIIWAKYRQDITLIIAALRKAGVSAVRYDGETKDLGAALESFWGGNAQLFVSNPAKGGEGLTLNEAKYMLWYNNSHKLLHRKQGEKRNDRIGQDADELVHYDIMGRHTIDELIVQTLRRKNHLAAVVQGDEIREWI